MMICYLSNCTVAEWTKDSY